LKELNFDYELLAKKILEMLPTGTSSVTLQSFVDEYLIFVERNRSAKTLEGVKLICKYLLKYFSPIKKIETIKLKEVEEFIESLKKTAPLGVYNYHRALRAMWNQGIAWDYSKENPFSKIKLKSRQAKKPAYITETELLLIVNYIEAEIVKDVILTAFYSGCRLGEIVNLTWQDVSLRENLITIGNNSFETKSRKIRIIPLHPKVKEILVKRFPKLIKSDKHYVFSKSNGCRYTGDFFSRRFKNTCRKAGMDPELHFHSLRHSFASSLIRKGIPLYEIKELLGHSSISCTEIYSHLSIDNLREAISKI
jgi:integrase